MSGRADKGRAVVRYLGGKTGIPFLRWDGNDGVSAPPPYSVDITTARKLQVWHDSIRDGEEHRLHMSIRYDKGMDGLESAWVAMTLKDFVVLLEAHYNSIQDRITTHKLGD